MSAPLRPTLLGPWVAILLALTLPSAAGAQAQRALRFESSGTPRYVTFGAAPSLGCSTLTVEVRFKRTSTSSVGITASTGTGGINAAPLVTKGRGEADNSNLDCNFFVGLDAAGRVAVDYEEGAGQTSPGLNHPMFSRTAVTDTLWHHAAVTFDGSATGTMRIYLDGVLDSTKAVGAKRLPRWDSIQHAGLATAMTSTGAASGNFQGILDEARVWGVARTDQQIADNMNAEILQGSGLLGRWGLSEGSGLSAGNSVANGVSGTLTNGPLWTTDSTLPQLTATGLRFGGSNAYVTFGNPAALGASTFTVETWFRLDGLGRATTTGGGGLARAIPLVAKGRGEADGSNVDMNYFLGVDSTTTKLVADFEDMASGANHPVTGSTILSTGVWYHAAATFDGSTFRLYLNGTLEGSIATTATPRFDSIQHAGLGTALNSAGVADGFLNGALDEARIWTVARSQSEIAAAMNSELTGPATGLAARWGMNEDGLTTIASSSGGTVNGAITGSTWAWASGAPFDAAPPSTPADPSGLAATAVSTTRIDLAWTDNANNEGSYEVERSTTGIGGSYSLLISLPASSAGYSDTGLAGGTEYCYRVRAVNGVGSSGYAGPACATTASPTPPAAPSDLVATAPTSGQAHLAWSDNSLDETSFVLERSIAGAGGPFSLLATLAANTTAYEDLNREPGAEYCYRVRAVNADGASGDAGPSCVTTPAATARALDLSGGAYARFGNPAELRLTAFTIEMWLRRDGAGSGTNTGNGGIPDAIPLVAKGRAEAENAFQDINYLFGIRASDGVLCADFEEGAGGASPSLNHPIAGVTPIPATGVWHHVAATYDGATWNLYLDGNLDATLAVNRPPAAACSVSVALGSALTSAGVAAGSFDGALDEVRIWNVARTQAEIRAAANAQLAVATPGLAARWSLDEGAGTTLNGSAGTQVAGTLLGGSSAWIGPAPFGLVFAPDAPSDLTANAPTSRRVNLSWTDHAVSEASYEVERSTTGVGGAYTLLATLPANSTSYADTSLTPSTEYCYRVRAVNAGGPSAYAGPACATTLAQLFTLAYTAGPNGTIVGVTPQTVSYNGSGTPVTATPNTGYHFVGWSDGVLTAARTDANVTADLAVTATFAINTYTLTYSAGANGTIVGVTPQSVDYDASGAPVTATPNTGYHFVTWSDGVLTATRTDANVTADLSVTASFAINTYTLATAVDPDGSGSVARSPDQPSYDHGSVVQLTAVPSTGYAFVSWSGDATGSGNPISVTMDAAKSVTAHFTPAFLLATSVDPPGAGSVTKSPDQASYPNGSSVDLAAAPATGYHFLEWTGDLTGSTNPQTVTMSADRSVTAHFAINTYTLTYAAGANGTIVGVTPQSVDYNASGTPVTATPNTGYHFVAWSDGVLTATRTDASVTADLSVTATFEIDPDALSFTGTNAYVSFGNPAALQLPAFTLEMWLRRDGTGAGTNTGTGGIPDLVPLIAKGRAEAEDPLKDINYILGISASTGVLAADFEEAAAPSPNPSLNHPVLGATPIAVGSWYHVAATYDGSAWRLYVNGTLDAQLAVGRAPASASNVPVALASALNSTSAAAGFFNGVLDEVRVWSTARSAGEIAQTMNSRLDTPTPGLVGRWSLDEGTGTQVASTAGVPLNGTVTGTGWAWTPGAPYNAPTFTIHASAGAGGAIAPAGSVAIGPGNGQTFTITPDACHDLADVLVDGVSVGAVGSYDFAGVGADHTIAASFALKTFTITATAGTGGSISPAGPASVGCGADQTYDITADPGYHVADVLVDGASVGAVATYTFSGVTAGHTIAGSFALNGDALSFTGTNGYVNLGNPVDLSLSAFTLELWMRREGPGVGGDTGAGGIPNLIPLLAKGRAESEDPLKDVNYALGIRASDGVLAADFEEAAAPSPNPSLNHPVLGVTPLAVGTWYHVAATYDGATWRLYVNGSLDAELAVGRAPASASTVAVGLASMLNSTGTPAGFFQGTMDEVRVWNGARTQADLIAAMNSRITTPTAGLVARWGLDEGSGSIVHSSAGAILDGTLAGTGWSWATGAPFNATPPSAPAPPTALQAAGALSQVDLSWTDNAGNETGFEIERSTSGSGGPFSPLASVGPDVVTYSDTGLSTGSEYCYRVRAVNAVGASSFEGPACATTLAAPTHALSFGGNTYVTFGDPAALDLPQFTLECWFRRDGAGATTSTGAGGVTDAIPLVTHGTSQSDGSNVDMNFFLGIKSSTGVLCADFEEGAGGSTPGLNHPILGTTPLVTGTWYHAAATYDGATWRLYLNGNPEAQLAVGQPVQSGSIQHAALASSITSTGTAQGYFVGVLDEVRIWSTVRSQAEIQAAANSQIAAAQAGLAARWSLDEGSGSAVLGSAGTSVTGAITGTSYSWIGPAPFDLSFTPPADPAALTATASSFSQIDLAWIDNSGNESAFEIERSTSGPGGAYTLLATVGANTTSYPDVGLAPSTEFCYRVRAVNGSGVSGYAGPTCATTPVATSTALDLAGNTYVNFGDNAALHLQTFTIEMWIRRDGAGVGTNTGTGGIADAIPLLAKGRADAEDPTRDINYLFGIQAATGVLCADFEEGAGGTSPSLNHPVLGATPIAAGGWHHVAATYDGESWNLYLDGIPDGTLTVGQPPAAGSIAPVAIGSALTSAVGAAGFFDGAVDEVRVWSVARTLQEIQSTANARISTATAGLVARWSLDEGAGTTVGGSAGSTINGAITGTAFSWVGGAPFNLSFNLPPSQPTVVAPAHNAVNVTTSPTLAVTVSDPDGQPVTVDFHGRSTTSAAGPDFTIVGVPDTQYYSGELNGGTNAIFQSQTNWMVANRASRNIAYVATLGDCVEHGDNGGNDIEWQRANTSLSILENPLTTGLPAGFPYGVTVGNHDQSPNGNPDGATTTFYNQYFGESRFLGRPYYGGHYGTNNDNWYDLFSASGMDFIVISLEYDPTPDAAILAWADNLLTTYSSRRAILLSHYFINTGNPATFGAQGQATYDALKSHANLFLMLCGHVPGEGRRQDTFGGNTVNTLLSDYQSRTNGGNGWLRIMEFSPANNVIRVKTYSPWLDQFEADADSSSQFTLLYNMSTTTAYTLLGSVAGVASGSNASLVWPGLQGNTTYEWYATVSDGATMTTGPVWRFTTTAGATYALTTAADPPAGGTVTRNPVDPTYPSGTTVTLTAVPSAGYEFRGWCGDASGPTSPTTVDMTRDKAVTAVFNEIGAPMVQVTSPNGGQMIQRGSLVEIHWTAEDAEGIDLVDVLLSRDGPNGPWETLGSDLSGATSFTWVATGPSTTHGFVRVVAHNPSSAAPSLTGWDLSDASFTITDVVTGVDEQPVTQFALRVASSNPMTDRAAIAFALPHEAEVRVDVLDVQGRRVANVVNRRYPAGRWTVSWTGRSADGTAVASGVYFLRFRTPDRVVTKRFALVR